MKHLLITFAKDEASYILEWICYHRLIGFTDVLVVTNDNSDHSIELYEKLKRHLDWFDFIQHSVPRTEAPSVNAIRLVGEWLNRKRFVGHACLCDVDEFLFLDKDDTVGEFWHRYPDADAIAVNWRIFGSSGHQTRNEGLVIERFTRCAPDSTPVHVEFKSLFRVDERLRLTNNHYPTFSHGGKYVYTDGQPLDPRTTTTDFPYTVNSRACFGVAQFNHYLVKSREEFAHKKKRGRLVQSIATTIGKQDRYTDRFFDAMDRNEQVDLRASTKAKAVRALMQDIAVKCDLGTRQPASLFDRLKRLLGLTPV